MAGMTDRASPTSPNTARWTPATASTFLQRLGEHGNAARAAREVGMSRKSAYALRARAPEFAKLWLVAVGQARTMAEVARLRRRAVHPLLDPQPLPAAREQGDISERNG